MILPMARRVNYSKTVEVFVLSIGLHYIICLVIKGALFLGESVSEMASKWSRTCSAFYMIILGIYQALEGLARHLCFGLQCT